MIIAFEAVARGGEYAGDFEVAGQRVAADGSMMWDDGDTTFIAASKWSERAPAIPGGAAVRSRDADEAGPARTGPATPGGDRRSPAKVNPVNP